ncbi:MAG TPA: hypothetical protein VIM07_02885 [Chitinophagaceae bacterium]
MLVKTSAKIIKPTEKLIHEFDQSTNALILLELTIPCHEAFINMEKINTYLVKEYNRYAKISYKSFACTLIILKIFEAKYHIHNSFSFFRRQYEELDIALRNI